MKENKSNKKAMFIKTKDIDTYEVLIKEGFDLVDDTNGVWTFVNDLNRPLTFENNKVAYSDMLCF